MNILFIGNSYTYYNDMPSMFERLAKDNGKNITVHSITYGGRKLLDYTNNEDAVTVSLDKLLKEEKFDICFIQEQSVLPAADFDGFAEGLDCVIGKLKGKAGELILYATWGRKSGSSELEERGWTTESMTRLLTEAYRKGADMHRARVSPVGSNFLYISENHPELELYDKDMSHPSYHGSCLAALTHYHTAFNVFPGKTDALSLNDTELAALKEAVCRAER